MGYIMLGKDKNVLVNCDCVTLIVKRRCEEKEGYYTKIWFTHGDYIVIEYNSYEEIVERVLEAANCRCGVGSG